MASNVYLGALWGHFGVTLASLWITLGTLEGQFGVTADDLGVTLHIFGVFSDRFGWIRVTSTSL